MTRLKMTSIPQIYEVVVVGNDRLHLPWKMNQSNEDGAMKM